MIFEKEKLAAWIRENNSPDYILKTIEGAEKRFNDLIAEGKGFEKKRDWFEQKTIAVFAQLGMKSIGMTVSEGTNHMLAMYGINFLVFCGWEKIHFGLQ